MWPQGSIVAIARFGTHILFFTPIPLLKAVVLRADITASRLKVNLTDNIGGCFRNGTGVLAAQALFLWTVF
jgi:hypothetical protein